MTALAACTPGRHIFCLLGGSAVSGLCLSHVRDAVEANRALAATASLGSPCSPEHHLHPGSLISFLTCPLSRHHHLTSPPPDVGVKAFKVWSRLGKQHASLLSALLPCLLVTLDLLCRGAAFPAFTSSADFLIVQILRL